MLCHCLLQLHLFYKLISVLPFLPFEFPIVWCFVLPCNRIRFTHFFILTKSRIKMPSEELQMKMANEGKLKVWEPPEITYSLWCGISLLCPCITMLSTSETANWTEGIAVSYFTGLVILICIVSSFLDQVIRINVLEPLWKEPCLPSYGKEECTPTEFEAYCKNLFRWWKQSAFALYLCVFDHFE